MQSLTRSSTAAFLVTVAAIFPWTAHAESSITKFSPEQFMGWEPKGASWNPITCDPGQTYTTSDGFVRCCQNVSSNCLFVTRCSSNIMNVSDKTQRCDDGKTCVTMTIYDASTAGGPYVRDMFCWNAWSAFTIFRESPITATSTSATVTIVPSVQATSPAPTATSTSSSSPESTSHKPDENKTWIVGAVVGSIAGCAVIGVLGFCIGRRRQRRSHPRTTPVDDCQGAEIYDEAKPYRRRYPLQELAGRDGPPAVEMEASTGKPHTRTIDETG